MLSVFLIHIHPIFSQVTIVLGSRLNQSFQQYKRIRKLHREARYLHIKSKINTMELHRQCKERYKLEVFGKLSLIKNIRPFEEAHPQLQEDGRQSG